MNGRERMNEQMNEGMNQRMNEGNRGMVTKEAERI